MRYSSIILGIAFILLVGGMTSFSSAAATPTACCEKTISGLYCQNAPAEQCAENFKQQPTACSSTSYCKIGTCYNSAQGTCRDNTPLTVCNNNGGTWSDKALAQCSLGCCVLGDQAAFVTLVRCKYLAGNLGLPISYNKEIKTESACLISVQNQDKGACVYTSEFQKTCKFATRADCASGVNGTKGSGEFYKDKLCTAPELGTNCAITSKTTCVPGKEEVYFQDSCGNPANIYDSARARDVNGYWTNIISKDLSCFASGAGVANSKRCGNCNYLLGSICRTSSIAGVTPDLGDYVCSSLNCKDSTGQIRIHGESWCDYTDQGKIDVGKNAVGSRYYKKICMAGEIVVEPCDDLRAQECISNTLVLPGGTKFSQAACRVNRWQDCNSQTEKIDCENADKRDCLWKAGYTAAFTNGTVGGVCIAKNPPGLTFWTGDEVKNICQKGSQACKVTFEKDLFGGKKCISGCECLTTSWLDQKKELCSSLGDCGSNINWIGDAGWKDGFKFTK